MCAVFDHTRGAVHNHPLKHGFLMFEKPRVAVLLFLCLKLFDR